MNVAPWMLAAGLVLIAAGCNDRVDNFSQYPGFADYYAANPPASTVPSDGEVALLRRFTPRVFLPDGHEGPIDFYRDYVASGVLRDGRSEVISTAVDRQLLDAHKTDPSVTFTHKPGDDRPTPTIYGRIDRKTVDWPGCGELLPLTFLTYHLVFRTSGLPAGLPWWQASGLGLIADLDDWHQLDHYTAITLTLLPSDTDGQHPIAVTFQQHNYQRTYLLKESDGPGRLMPPADGRIEIDVALRSNELYPHRPGRNARRAVSFLDPGSAAYMVADGARPWLAADDITDPVTEIDPELVFLPPDDAFYTFQGWLGERRRLPGRDGPPGADYNTLPPMKPLLHQVALSWWYPGDLDWLERFQALFADGWPEDIDPGPFVDRIAEATALEC